MWTAAFFDGKSAALRDVAVRFDDDALHLSEKAGGNSADGLEITWPYRSLVLIFAESGGGRIELSSTEAPEARLRLVGTGIHYVLLYRAPHLGHADWKSGSKITAGIVAGLAVLLAVLYFLPVLLVPLIPDSYAARLGDRTAGTIRQFFGGTCALGDGDDVLNNLGARLAATDGYDGPLHVEVIDSPIVNALALPGGRVMIFRGLIEKAETPDEVTGVLAHEMGHVEHRHGLTNLIRSLGLQVVISGLMGGTTGDLSTFLLSMSFSREAEMQADETAIKILNAANISAEPFAAFFDRLGESSAAKVVEEDSGFFAMGNLLASHPPTPERAALARRTGLSAGTVASLSPEQWQSVRADCLAPPEETEEVPPEDPAEDQAEETEEDDHDPVL